MSQDYEGYVPAPARKPILASAMNQSEICATCPSRISGFCSRLDQRTLERLSQQSVRVPMSAHDVRDGADFYILIRGVLQSVHHDVDGKRRIVGLVLPGEAIDGSRRNEQFEDEAATPAMACRIQAAQLQRATADSHTLRQELHALTLAQLDRLQDLACALAVLGPDERVAGFLLNAITFLPWQPLPGGGGILTMTMERPDIADLLCTTVETLCRVLRRFHGDGLILMRDARHFEIPDPARLRPRAC